MKKTKIKRDAVKFANRLVYQRSPDSEPFVPKGSAGAVDRSKPTGKVSRFMQGVRKGVVGAMLLVTPPVIGACQPTPNPIDKVALVAADEAAERKFGGTKMDDQIKRKYGADIVEKNSEAVEGFKDALKAEDAAETILDAEKATLKTMKDAFNAAKKAHEDAIKKAGEVSDEYEEVEDKEGDALERQAWLEDGMDELCDGLEDCMPVPGEKAEAADLGQQADAHAKRGEKLAKKTFDLTRLAKERDKAHDAWQSQEETVDQVQDQVDAANKKKHQHMKTLEKAKEKAKEKADDAKEKKKKGKKGKKK